MTKRLTLALPFHFDGHGVNDATGQRMLTIDLPNYTDGRTRNPQVDILGRLAENSPTMERTLRETKAHLAKLISETAGAPKESPLFPLYCKIADLLDLVDVDTRPTVETVEESNWSIAFVDKDRKKR